MVLPDLHGEERRDLIPWLGHSRIEPLPELLATRSAGALPAMIAPLFAPIEVPMIPRGFDAGFMQRL
jgi:hypothetical protein